MRKSSIIQLDPRSFTELGIGPIFAGLFIILVAFLSLFLLEARKKGKAEGAAS